MVRILFCLLCCAALAMQGLSTKAENTNSSSSSATESPIPRPTSFQDVSTAPSYTTVATTSTTNSNKSNLTLPMVINTWNYPEANDYAWRILRQTEGGLGQTRNAVVEGCGKCEQTQCRRSVGYGGTPNELGEITLDAMVMDGATMDVGAVAGLVDVKEAIRVARHVLERTKHTMLVGPGASKFAVAMGFRTDSLVTPQTHAEWLQWKAENCQPNFWRRVYPDPEISCGPYSLKATPLTRMKEEPARTEFKLGPQNHDTIGMVAIDANSQIHTGTSTNGLDYKIHGRVGDSPVAGAGSYADNEVGAAVATGDGDISMRFLPTFLAVEAMRAGKTPGEAAAASVKRIVKHYKDYFGAIIAVNRLGQYAAACYGMSEFPFIVSNPAEGTVVKRVKCMPAIAEVNAVTL